MECKWILLILVSALFISGCGPTADEPTEQPDVDPNKYMDDILDSLREYSNLVDIEKNFIDSIDLQKLKDNEEYRRRIVEEYRDICDRMVDVVDWIGERGEGCPESLEEFNRHVKDALNAEWNRREMIKLILENPQRADWVLWEWVKEAGEDAKRNWKSALEEIRKQLPGRANEFEDLIPELPDVDRLFPDEAKEEEGEIIIEGVEVEPAD